MANMRPVHRWIDTAGALLLSFIVALAAFSGMLFQALTIVVALACVVGVGSRIQGYRARDIQRVTPSALRKPELRWHRAQLFVRFTFLIVWLSLFLAVVGVLPALGKSALIGASVLVGTLAIGWSLLTLFPRRTIGIANNLALAVCSLVIALMWVMPLVNASSARISLSLPVDAPLLVFQGGRTPLTNHHYLIPSQRHALDLVALDGSGVAIDDDEQRPEGNAQVFGYGLPVVAPISGEIALVKEGYSDEKGDVNNPAGNHVVIRTEAGVFVLMAHLKHESITVKSGQRVATGDQIGQLGNSGNSSMPHLHIQVQDAANLDQVKETFPIEFTDSNVRGRAPSRGDVLTGGTHPTKQ